MSFSFEFVSAFVVGSLGGGSTFSIDVGTVGDTVSADSRSVAMSLGRGSGESGNASPFIRFSNCRSPRSLVTVCVRPYLRWGRKLLDVRDSYVRWAVFR